MKVTDKNKFERVDGSSVGGGTIKEIPSSSFYSLGILFLIPNSLFHPNIGTFWGLCALLTGRTDFDEMLQLAAQGKTH